MRTFLAATLLFAASSANAQQLAPATKFIRENSPAITLTHVQLIDGTRAAAQSEKTSMIGVCQEAKSSPEALGRSAVQDFFLHFSAPVGLSAAVPHDREPHFHWLAHGWPCPARLSLCSPASLETYQRRRRELALSRPVG